MAFDVKGARGAGAQVVGTAGGRMVRLGLGSGSRLPVPFFDGFSLASRRRGRRERRFLHR